MKLYLDAAAIVKLVSKEPESEGLRRFLGQRREYGIVTSSLSRVEVVRAVLGGGARAVALARRQLSRFDHVELDRPLLDQAAVILSGTLLRSLDAIHLASASLIGPDLGAVVTYDRRLAQAAEALGMTVESPQ